MIASIAMGRDPRAAVPEDLVFAELRGRSGCPLDADAVNATPWTISGTRR